MFDLTLEERQALVFLLCLALLGVGVDFALKKSAMVARFVRVEERMLRIDLNSVTLEELQHTRGVSPSLARKIVDYRQANGPFSCLEDLKKVKGIGEYRYSRLEKLFFVP